MYALVRPAKSMMIVVSRIQSPIWYLDIGNALKSPEPPPSRPPSPGKTGGGVMMSRRSSVITGITSYLVLCLHSGRHSLGNKIFPFTRDGEIEGPAVDRRKLYSKITMSRRIRQGPFKRGCVPRVVLDRAPAAENAEEEVEEKDQLAGAENECSNRNEDIDRLLRHEKHVLGRIIN